MYDDLRAYLTEQGMMTHAFYLTELIDDAASNGDDRPNVFDAFRHIDTQARLDTWFQETMKDTLDYCHPRGDGTWACMTVGDQIEYIVRPDYTVVSESDGMGA